VEVAIEAAPDGRRIRLVQRGFPTAEARDDVAGAWPDVLAQLAGPGFAVLNPVVSSRRYMAGASATELSKPPTASMYTR